MIADRWGEAKLVAFYRAVGAHRKRPGAVESALRGRWAAPWRSSPADWQEYLRAQLG